VWQCVILPFDCDIAGIFILIAKKVRSLMLIRVGKGVMMDSPEAILIQV